MGSICFSAAQGPIFGTIFPNSLPYHTPLQLSVQLSIPTPRCLHNSIKLRIFPPTNTSSSFASLSSNDEDGGAWDLASDPHVTRSASSRNISRTTSYTQLADDESSDSSTAGFSDGCGIQGTFPSAERIRVRWAKPLKSIDVPGGVSDGRRRVGVKESKGEMVCLVRGRATDQRTGKEGVLMDVDYKGSCKGVWFAGVATLLGMDVGLESKGSDVSWVSGFSNNWEITGGKGYTGFDIGETRSGIIYRHDSLDSNSPQIHISSSSPHAGSSGHPGPSRHNSTSSVASSSPSLLRAPLPQNVAEYSFEGSASSSSSQLTSSQITSSMSSLPTSTPNLSRSEASHPPGCPITLHLNMNELLSPSRNNFTFSISGTILVTPRPTIRSNGRSPSSPNHSPEGSGNEADPEPIVLPRFTVLAADTESTSILVRNGVEDGNANIEVYNSTGDIRRDAQSRKTVLQKGAYTKCGEDGGRIALRSVGTPTGADGSRMLQPPSRPVTPSSNAGRRSPADSPASGRKLFPTRRKRDGPLMIPSVTATVTPLVSEDGFYPDAYAVRVSLPAPTSESEWLEFGLAKPGPASGSVISLRDRGEKSGKPPKVDIVSVSVEGVPVRFDTSAAVKQEKMGGLGVPFEEMSGKEWFSWIRVHVGNTGGGEVVVDYVVKENDGGSLKGKAKAKDELMMNVFLPTFAIAVGRLEVVIEGFNGKRLRLHYDLSSSSIADLEISTLQSNLTHQRPLPSGRQLLHYTMEEFFYPHLSFTLQAPDIDSSSSLFHLKALIYVLLSSVILGFLFLLYVNSELREIGHALKAYSFVRGSSDWDDMPEPVTITTTLYTGSKWWFRDECKETDVTYIDPQTASIFLVATTTTTPPPYTTITPSESPVLETSLSQVPPSPYSETFASYTQSLAMIPAKLSSVSWEDFRPVARVALRKVSSVFGVLWHVVMKVYHYPLEPEI